MTCNQKWLIIGTIFLAIYMTQNSAQSKSNTTNSQPTTIEEPIRHNINLIRPNINLLTPDSADTSAIIPDIIPYQTSTPTKPTGTPDSDNHLSIGHPNSTWIRSPR
jgi:hypothetical protein